MGTAYVDMKLVSQVRTLESEARRSGSSPPTAAPLKSVGRPPATTRALDEAANAFALLALLEGEAAALAATRFEDAAPLREMKRLCETSTGSLEDDARFHFAITQLAGNARLAATIRDLRQDITGIAPVVCRQDGSAGPHADLLAAILASDAGAARAIAVAHLRTAHADRVRHILATDRLAGGG